MRPGEADRAAHAAPAAPAAGESPGPASGPRWRLPIAPAPRFVQLETVTTCNARCPFCPQHEVRRDPPLMPDATWRRILDQTRGLGITYRPFLTNEPFVDRRQPEIVGYLRAHDPTARVEYNTNGALLTEELGRRLLDLGVEIVRFSIDGFSAESYGRSRVGIDYGRVLSRVTRFLELWDRGGYRQRTHTEVRIIRLPENEPELDAFRTYWAPRCSEVVVTDLYRWPWTGQQPEEAVLRPCLKVLDEMFFYADGKATLCCWDVLGRAVIGDVAREPVLAIWEGHAVRHLRALLEDGRRDLIHLCSRCDAYRGYDFGRFARPAGGGPAA